MILCLRHIETKPIFLGPQNRNWNAGCHVNRDYADVCGRGKFSSDNHERNGRIGDRRDSRGGHAGFRDRGFIRKDRSFGKQNEQRDEQPEWFVDGPSTINDTIELGDVIEYDRRKDGEGPTKMKASGDCDESKKSNSPKVIQHTLSDLEGDIKALSVDEDIGKKAASSEKNQGSRLKHLFAMADADNSSKCDCMFATC